MAGDRAAFKTATECVALLTDAERNGRLDHSSSTLGEGQVADATLSSDGGALVIRSEPRHRSAGTRQDAPQGLGVMWERVVLTLAGIVALVGALIVLGWAVDAILIPSGVAASPRVKANTGVCFVLAGLAVWLSVLGRGVWLGRMLGVVVVVIGGLSLIESVFGVNFGIDQLLFRDPARLDPGRMAPNAALAFVLCGTALLLFARKRRRLVAEALGVAAAVIGWLALVGFAGGLFQLVQVGAFVEMALPTAICFLLLGSAVVLAAAGGRLVTMLASQSLAGPLVRRLLAAVIVAGPLASVLLRFGHSSGLLDQGAVILLTLAVVAMSLLAVALAFAHSLDATDVSRLRAEQELRDSERRYRELAEGSIDAFISMDHNGVITGWNPAAEALFGWPAEEAIGRTVAETIVPESLRSRHRAGLQRLAAGGPASAIGQRLELAALRRDGREVPIELYISVNAGRGGHRFHAFVHDISDRVDARRALESKHRQLDDAQAIAHVGSWSWEPATDSTEWSAEMYRIFDRDPAQGPAAGEDFFAYLHPDDHDRIAAGYAQAFGAGEGFRLDYRIVLGEGEVRFLHGIGQRERDGWYVGTVQDVTAIEAERANRMLAMIVAESDDAILAKTLPDGVITEWNRGAERLYGYTASEIVGQPVSLLIPLERTGDEREIVRQVLADGSVPHYETRRVRKDGSVIDVSLTISAIHDAEGRIVGASAISRDITERKRVEAALRETEQLFRGAFEKAPIGMAMLELDGRFAKVNDALCQILGYPGEQLEGMREESITHPDDIGAEQEAIAEMRGGKRTSLNTEKRYLNASGHPVFCAMQATVITDEDGQPRSFLSQIQDITDRKRHEEQLEYLADHDALTGLPNRRSFARELEAHAQRVARYGPDGTVLMIDLDQFKFVNDTHGHHAGDELIVRVGQLLAERLRESDVLARLGGDEFAVLLPQADASAAKLVATSVLDTLRSAAIPIAGTERRITASIGIASFEDGPGLSAEDVMINADLALYDAKEDGRDRVVMFRTDQHGQARMKGRISWAQRITAALETDSFTLLAQPIVDLATGRASQYELLLRMNDPHGDLIPPSAFLYVAERLDLIREIDAWVVSHGIRTLAELDPSHEIAVEINLSGRSLGDQKLLEHIDTELRNAQVAPERIIFEITETAAVTSVTKARAFGEHLAEIGCRFALDDFGAGFGSFYYLKHLVFDYLKIDGEFIRDCRANPTDKLFIKAIVDMARGMSKQTIAEFVGDDETVRLLTRLGVDYGQGYHLGMPAPLHQQLATTSPPSLTTPSTHRQPHSAASRRAQTRRN